MNIREKIKRFKRLLFKPVDGSSLAVFRFLFGAIMVWEAFRFIHGKVAHLYIQPDFVFPFFSFVKPLPESLMYLPFFVYGLASIGIALGYCYRFFTILFFVSYTYIFLLDKAPYNNHYYLISLLGFLLIFMQANKCASLDIMRNPKIAGKVPFWNVFLLRSQIFIVYFFGGIAKLNWDWLRGEPVRTWLAERSSYFLIGPYLTNELVVYFYAYGGLIFDLAIGFLLLYRPTQLVAFFLVIIFHLMNSWFYSIGVFPLLGIASAVIFFDPALPRRLLNKIMHFTPFKFSWPKKKSTPVRYRKWITAFIFIYLIIQIFMPLRHWLYEGNVSWTEEGHNFAWHMKLRAKHAQVKITFTDPETNLSQEVNLSEDLTEKQIQEMSERPHMLIQYVEFLEEKYKAEGIRNPVINADVKASLNGRPNQQLIDPNVNLADVKYSVFRHNEWILQLSEDLPARGNS